MTSDEVASKAISLRGGLQFAWSRLRAGSRLSSRERRQLPRLPRLPRLPPAPARASWHRAPPCAAPGERPCVTERSQHLPRSTSECNQKGIEEDTGAVTGRISPVQPSRQGNGDGRAGPQRAAHASGPRPVKHVPRPSMVKWRVPSSPTVFFKRGQTGLTPRRICAGFTVGSLFRTSRA